MQSRILITGFVMLMLIGCRSTSNTPANQKDGRIAARELSAVSDSDLIDQIEVFATDIGEEGEAAWKQLEAYQRQELVDRLLALRDTSDQDEFIKTNIAFLLCHLDQDYQSNREIIVFAFNQSPDTAELYEAQIDRLIKRGDNDLLQVLFAIAPKSAGALSEGLADTFAYQLKSNTEAFLMQLRTQPRTIRSQVSDLIDSATSDQDKITIKAFLKSIPETSPIAGIAKEIDSDLSQVKID